MSATVEPRGEAVRVRLVGQVDLSGRAALDNAARELLRFRPHRILVDVAEVSFAGAALPNFLAQLHAAMPDGCSLTVCRPSNQVSWVLGATAMAKLADIRADGPVYPH